MKDYPETSGPLDSDLPVLTNIVQSHRTLEELHVGKIIYENDSTDPSTNLLQLIEAAGNSQLKELKLHESDYDKLPPHIHKQYKHLVKRRGRISLLSSTDSLMNQYLCIHAVYHHISTNYKLLH